MRNAGLEVQPLSPIEISAPIATQTSPIATQTRKGAENPVRDHENKTPEWIRALAIVIKHWRLSATFAVVVIVTTAAVTYSMKDVYEPWARIEVDPPGESFSLDGGITGGDAEYLETQAKNLKGDRLAVAVIRKLRLDQNPDIVPDAKIRVEEHFQPSPGADVLKLTPAEN